MKFDSFYELEIPRPWGPGKEQRIFREGLEQVELADRLGFDSVWATEHHFLEEYAHSSAPEVSSRPAASAPNTSGWATA